MGALRRQETITIGQNQSYGGEIATFTDANPYAAAGQFATTLNWSDGTTTTGTITIDPQVYQQFDVGFGSLAVMNPTTNTGGRYGDSASPTPNTDIMKLAANPARRRRGKFQEEKARVFNLSNCPKVAAHRYTLACVAVNLDDATSLGPRSVAIRVPGLRFGQRSWALCPGRLLAMNDVTRILSAIEQGDPKAADQLLPLVYHELRKLAAQKLASEKPGQTLGATALVHEAYLRLVVPAHGASQPPADIHWNTSGHFFTAAAEAMRRILIDRARHKQSQRRGGGRRRQDIEHDQIAAPEPSLDVLAVNEALERFEKLDPLKAQLVKLRYFAGLTIPQAADALGISTSTADRYWAYARAWLHAELKNNA